MSDTLANALVGAVVTTVTAPIVPGAPLVGGLAAGYLQRGDRMDGVRVGALSGGLAVLPLVFLAVAFGGLLVGLVGAGPPGAGLLGGLGVVVLSLLVVVGLAYLVVLGAVGGWVGAYLVAETDS